jgi:hypothetical protein
MQGRGLLAIAALAAAVGGGRVARGQEEGGREVVRLAYASSPGSPGRESFEARVRARTARALFEESGSAPRIFEVELGERPSPHGRFAVWRKGVVEGARDVSAETCSDLADAVALAIDPSAVSPPSAERAPAAPAVSLAPSPAEPVPLASAASTSVAPVIVFASRPVPSRERPAPTASVFPHTLFFEADYTLATGVASSSLAAFSPRLGWRGRSDSLVVLSLSLAFVRASSGNFAAAGGDASFTWTVGRGDACALSWPRGSAHLLACARIEVGQLEASGLQVTNPQKQGRPWLAAGPLLRGEWELLRPLFLTGDVAATVHVTDDRFYFLPDSPTTTVREVPLLGLEASAGLGVHFL